MELLVRVLDDPTAPDGLYHQAHMSWRGDVVVVQEDGSYWGPMDLGNPQKRVIRVAIPQAEAAAMTSSEPGDSLVNRLLHHRLFTLDLDIFGPLGSGVITDISVDVFRKARKRKDSLKDPMVIG